MCSLGEDALFLSTLYFLLFKKGRTQDTRSFYSREKPVNDHLYICSGCCSTTAENHHLQHSTSHNSAVLGIWPVWIIKNKKCRKCHNRFPVRSGFRVNYIKNRCELCQNLPKNIYIHLFAIFLKTEVKYGSFTCFWRLSAYPVLTSLVADNTHILMT